MNRLRKWTNWFIYASVILGILLLAQLYAVNAPSFLRYSIFAGWLLYLAVAIAVATGRSKAYPAALALAIVTLVVSVPQPAHLSFARASPTLAALTFIIGSLLQIGVIITVVSSLIVNRKDSHIRNY